MTSDEPEDPTIPSQPAPESDDDAFESRTVPSLRVPGSGGAPAQGDAADPADGERTVPSTPADEDRTVPSAPAGGDDATAPAMDAQALVGTEQLIGRTIGGCRIDKLLGRGAMGAVYKARQLKLDRDVAVKVIRPEMMTDARMLKRFEVEARTVGKFNSANVVMVHDVGFEHGVHYLVMEFVQGENLREHVKLLAGGRLPAGEALPLIRQACKGLEEARRLSVVHRDIKPDNLMLTEHGVLKIADFGIAKPVEDDFSMTLTSELIGTPLYMSPEQCQGGADVDFRSDMYSLGATFFYLLTGEPPIRASSVYELIQTKTKLENLCLWKALPELEEGHPLSRVIERMTANDRDDRYESYEELLNDLVLVEAGETIRTKVKRIKKAQKDLAPAEGKRSRGLLVVLVLLLLGGGGGGYWWWSQRGPGSLVGGGENAELAVKARQSIDRIRGRLKQPGPSEGLRKDLEGVKIPAAMGREVELLAADIEDGLRVKATLAELARPAAPELPFEDLDTYFKQVADVKLSTTAGGEVRAWLQERNQQDRDELGGKALQQLTAAFQGWQRERKAAGTEAQRLVELRQELGTIRSGRQKVYDLFQKLRGDLDKSLSAKDLDDAERGLEPEGPRPDEDAAERLEALGKEFGEKGPLQRILDEVGAVTPMTDADNAAKKDLQDAIESAQGKKQRLEGLVRPKARDVVVLVGEVDTFFRSIDEVLGELERDDGSIPAWAEQLGEERRDFKKLQADVEAAFTSALEAWAEDVERGISVATLRERKGQLEAADRTARELFSSATGLLTAANIQALADGLKKAEAELRIEKFRTDLSEARDRLRDANTLELWAKKQGGLESDTLELRRQLKEMGPSPQAERDLEQFEADCERWRKAAAAVAEAARLFESGELRACFKKIQEEFRQLRVVVQQAESAFRLLDRDADIRGAKEALRNAELEARAVPIVAAKIQEKLAAWIGQLDAFADKAVGMVPIDTQQGGAFFMSGTETSRGEFRAFQRDVREAAAGDDGAPALARVADRLTGAGLDEATFKAMLDTAPKGDDDLPLERVLWREAMAYCLWKEVELPTEAEWKLAAFGPSKTGETHPYSWGDEQPVWKTSAVKVKDGGVSWRHSDLRHLSDNVSEWLAAEGEARPLVIGASYAMGSGGARAVKGEAKEGNTMRRKGGVGFRVVLRPKTFFGTDWPR